MDAHQHVEENVRIILIAEETSMDVDLVLMEIAKQVNVVHLVFQEVIIHVAERMVAHSVIQKEHLQILVQLVYLATLLAK